ncbi:MAG: hypothetical protein K8T90_02740 [Planctomycetes bacterium]|nr:hypothetical protein [Planctomycetota bacterium]
MSASDGGGRRNVVLIAAGVLVAITAIAAVVADQFLDRVTEKLAKQPGVRAEDPTFTVVLTRDGAAAPTHVTVGGRDLGEVGAPATLPALAAAAKEWNAAHAPRSATSDGGAPAPMGSMRNSARAVVDAGPGVPDDEADRVVDVLVAAGIRAVTYSSGPVATPR